MLENIRDNIKNEIVPNILHDDKETDLTMDELLNTVCKSIKRISAK